MAYVYRHIRLDKNEPFYIGIGSDSNYYRAYQIKSDRRNNVWNKIASKTDIEIEIMLDDLTWEQACEKEREFISLYGRIDKSNGILANLTDGGDGTIGIIVSEENRKKLSQRTKGENNPMFGKSISKESIQKRLLKIKGRPAWNKGLKGVQKAHNCKIVLDFNTGVYYESAKEAAEAINMKHSTLKSKLNGSNKNNTSLKYV